jgi:hypothetical protein
LLGCGLPASLSGRARSPTPVRCRRKRGSKTGPSPVDRGRPGSKHRLLVDATGIPLAFSVTGGNRNDITQLIPLLDAVPAVAGVRGRPRRRPDSLLADRAYDHDTGGRGVTGWEWIFVILAVFLDVASWGGGARQRGVL